jgi:hypothetical protein
MEILDDLDRIHEGTQTMSRKIDEANKELEHARLQRDIQKVKYNTLAAKYRVLEDENKRLKKQLAKYESQ